MAIPVTGAQYLLRFLFLFMFLVMEYFVSHLQHKQVILKAQPKEKIEKTLADINQRRHELPGEEKSCRFPLSEDIPCLVPFKLVSAVADPSSISGNSH